MRNNVDFANDKRFCSVDFSVFFIPVACLLCNIKNELEKVSTLTSLENVKASSNIIRSLSRIRRKTPTYSAIVYSIVKEKQKHFHVQSQLVSI